MKSFKPLDLNAADPREIERILRGLEATADADANWQVGDLVRVNEGPFKGFSGMIERFSPDRHTLGTVLKIFGRLTPVEVDFSQVQKL